MVSSVILCDWLSDVKCVLLFAVLLFVEKDKGNVDWEEQWEQLELLIFRRKEIDKMIFKKVNGK